MFGISEEVFLNHSIMTLDILAGITLVAWALAIPQILPQKRYLAGSFSILAYGIRTTAMSIFDSGDKLPLAPKQHIWLTEDPGLA